MAQSERPWYRELNRYHWFVLIVCTLGWMFDCLDQQLFNGERRPAIQSLLPDAPPGDVDAWAGYSTSILLIGWATGGIFFGVLGDRIGRAKTMVWTVLTYSVFTGLTGFAFTVWDFTLYRFLTGLGVGGQFAVGVSLVAEALPDRTRPPALGMLQAMSTVGNMIGAMIVMFFEHLSRIGALPHDAWRWIFGVGVFPALLVVLIIRKLHEPERWQKAVAGQAQARKAGSIRELFGDPRWRKHTIVGMVLAAAGVVGLWGIGVFSTDLVRMVFNQQYVREEQEQGAASADQEFLRLAVQSPDRIAGLKKTVPPAQLIGPTGHEKDFQLLYAAAIVLSEKDEKVTPESTVTLLDEPAARPPTTLLDKLDPLRKAQSAADRQRRLDYFSGAAAEPRKTAQESGVSPPDALQAQVERIAARQKQINGNVGFWASINLMFFNAGAFFGVYVFSLVTQRIGRRLTFVIFFLLAMLSTAFAFMYIRQPWHLFCLSPLMGFFQLSVFGGYAIYFPELFPTRLRSTGTSFCYNIARFVAALGPSALGLLTSQVYQDYNEPMRLAGVTMCLIYLVGIAAVAFAPETKGQPLPE
jgi:MFS family permease